MPILKRIPFYFLAFFLAPLIAGITLTFGNMAELMIHKEPEAPAGLARPAPAPDAPGKLRALILLGHAGTEITDLLASYGVLSESGLFEVRTAAAEKKLLATTADVAVLADYALAEAPRADLIVIPSVLDPSEKELVDWVRARAGSAKLILTLSEGARVGAKAGIFTRRNATSHFLALRDLREVDPTAHWVSGARYVADGNTISSSGALSGIDAALFAIERAAGSGGRAVAERTAERLHYAWSREPDASGFDPAKAPRKEERLTGRDYLLMMMRGGYDWTRRQIAVAVFPGASELGLAAAFDTFPRMQSARVYAVGAARSWIPTRNGLHLLPGHAAPDAAKNLPADLIVVPSGIGHGDTPPPTDPLQDPAMHQYAVETQAAVKSSLYDFPGQAFEKDLALTAELAGPGIARLAAKLLAAPGEPPSSTTPDWPLTLWLRPFLIGVLGMWVVWVFDRMLFRPRPQEPEKPARGRRAAASGKRVTSKSG